MYLKEEGFYGDLYDLSTIKECLRIKEFWDKKVKDFNGDGGVVGRGLDLQLYFFKGERYRGKKAFIRERMEEGRKKDEKLDRIEEPKAIRCFKCQVAMGVIFKDLYCDTLRVLFFFECPKCGKRKGMFDDGQAFMSKGAKLNKAELGILSCQLKGYENEEDLMKIVKAKKA